jgi:hypothetical protein
MSVSVWLSTEKRIDAKDPVLMIRKRYVLLRSMVYLEADPQACYNVDSSKDSHVEERPPRARRIVLS